MDRLRRTPYPNSIDRNNPRFPAAFNQAGTRGAILVHVETMLPSGQSSVKEGVYDLNDGRGANFALKELRGAAPRYLDALRQIFRDGSLGPC